MLRCLFFPGGLQRSTAVGNRSGLVRAEHLRILVDHRKGATQDGSGGAAILTQHHQVCVRETAIEELKGGAGGPAEAVDRLVRIADGKNVSLLAGEGGEQLNLGIVRILEFIHQDEPGAGSFRGQGCRGRRKEFVRTGDHVAEGAPVFFQKPPLQRGVNAGDLTAAAQHFRIV